MLVGTLNGEHSLLCVLPLMKVFNLAYLKHFNLLSVEESPGRYFGGFSVLSPTPAWVSHLLCTSIHRSHSLKSSVATCDFIRSALGPQALLVVFWEGELTSGDEYPACLGSPHFKDEDTETHKGDRKWEQQGEGYGARRWPLATWGCLHLN